MNGLCRHGDIKRPKDSVYRASDNVYCAKCEEELVKAEAMSVSYKYMVFIAGHWVGSIRCTHNYAGQLARLHSVFCYDAVDKKAVTR